MGTYWYRMIPKPEYLSEIRYWIGVQAEAIREYAGLFADDLQPYHGYVYNPDQDNPALLRCEQAWRKLGEMVHVPGLSEDFVGDIRLESKSVGWMGKYSIFPAEWRVAAYRSYLPEEVPVILHQWREYIYSVRNGGYRPYLLNWYLYYTSCQTHDFWFGLKDVMKDAEGRTNAWAVRLFETDIPDKIRNLPEPPLYSAPTWVDWADDAGVIDYETHARYVELMEHRKTLHELRVAWNRYVPSKKKLPTSYPPYADRSFEGYLGQANDSSLDQLFAWLEQCVVDGVGLFIW